MKRVLVLFYWVACSTAWSADPVDATIYNTDNYGRQQEPAYRVENGTVYKTDKYGRKRYPAYVIKEDKVYRTDKYGRKQEQVEEVGKELPP